MPTDGFLCQTEHITSKKHGENEPDNPVEGHHSKNKLNCASYFYIRRTFHKERNELCNNDFRALQ